MGGTPLPQSFDGTPGWARASLGCSPRVGPWLGWRGTIRQPNCLTGTDPQCVLYPEIIGRNARARLVVFAGGGRGELGGRGPVKQAHSCVCRPRPRQDRSACSLQWVRRRCAASTRGGEKIRNVGQTALLCGTVLILECEITLFVKERKKKEPLNPHQSETVTLYGVWGWCRGGRGEEGQARTPLPTIFHPWC